MGIQISGVTKKFGKKMVLNDISLDFGEQGLVFILGASGSGKSTLLNCIASFDKQYDGSIIVKQGNKSEPIEVKKNNKNRLLKEYYDFIFQDYNLINSLTVEDNIKLSVELSSTSFDSNRYEEILNKLGIKEFEKRNVRDLSGGEKQRTAIARAILRNSPVILADEPTGNLDSQSSRVIFELLKDLSVSKLVIIVSHNEEAASKYGDRIVKISDGKILDDIGTLPGQAEKQCGFASKVDANGKQKTIGWIWKCMLSNLRYRKKKWIPMLLILSFCLFAFGMVLGLKNGMNNLVTNITYKTMECDKYEFILDRDQFISVETANWLETEEKIAKSMIYPIDYLTISMPNNLTRQPQIVLIDDSDTFDGRYTLREGAYPEKGEVMLCPNAAIAIFGTADCIGKELYLRDSSAIKLSEDTSSEKEQGIFVVSGVTATINDINGSLYVLKSDVEDLLLQSLYSPYMGAISLCKNENTTAYYSVFLEKGELNKTDILFGELPKKDSEIVIDSLLARHILTEQGILESESAPAAKEFLKQLLGMELELRYQNVFLKQVVVVGIAEEKESYSVGTVYVNRKITGEELKFLSRSAIVYLNDITEETLEELESKAMKYGAEYGLSRKRAEWAVSVFNFTEIMTYIMMAVTVLIFVVTVCIIYYATKIHIIEQSYEMGVIKSLGAGNEFVFQIFFYEELLLGVAAALFSGVVLFVTDALGIIQIYQVSVMKTSLLHFVMLLIISVSIVLLSSITEIIKISRMPIVQAIGSKHI
ncbi:MAG: ATP-binding cassette domain-containing protein [Lachnospiraceae bacterium]|nr:ATP-binding cassette domain-containing protein [Lachnospiraceae bacterium]